MIVADELLLGHRQEMWVMNLVHPITALYLGPVWVWVYVTRRRTKRPVALAVSHCGAGCTLGDIGGEWILWAAGIGGMFGYELGADFALAWTLGIAFQSLTIEGSVWDAIKVDTLSILAFQLGLFGWMALSHFALFRPPLPVHSAGHWFMMQVGMIVGFATAWPANRRLIRSGLKEEMA